MLLHDREELRHVIALTMLPSVGPVTARALLKSHGSARAFFQTGKADALISSASCLQQADRELAFLEEKRIVPLYFRDQNYPELLKECHDGPVILYCKGEPVENYNFSLSVVGTRRASSYGKDMCLELIRGLAERMPDIVIISGLAYGIDIIAHRASLDNGLSTVAVLGHGLHTLYPSVHRETARRIMKQGALLSDFDSGMGPERNNFLRRNRIIAGMSRATLVVESSERGGSLTTASMALSYNREVLAVPGRTTDIRSAGCNNLVKRDIAALICEPEDIIRALGWENLMRPGQEQQPSPVTNPTEKVILKILIEFPGSDPGSISLRSGIPIQDILASLLEMEINGHVGSEAGNRYRSLHHPG